MLLVQRRIARASLGALNPSSRAVVRELLVHGPQPRAELARQLQLSPASLTKTTRELMDRGVLVENPEHFAVSGETRGRPGTPISIEASHHQLIGIKVTGDGIFAVRTDAVGRMLDTRHRPLDATDVDHVTEQIVHVVNEMGSGNAVEAIGIGLAGAMTRFDDHVRSNAYLGWDEVALSELIEARCGLPTVISGDVRALTAGVQWWGPGRGLDTFGVLTVGVGIGIGLVLGGEVIAGPRGALGMVGHQLVDPAGPVCPEGHRGCASAYLTTAAITRTVSVAHGIRDLTLEGVCALADDGDPAARRVLADAGRAAGAIIAGLVNLLDLPTIVLAGDGLGVVQRARGELEGALADSLDQFAHPPELHVLASDFDEWARGAAVVACQWLLLDPPARDRLRPALAHPH